MGRLNWKCLTWLFTSAAVTIFLQPADKKICTVGDRCSLLPEMLAGHYHILFLLWRHPESACQARRDPGPTELDSREAEPRSKFMLDSSRGFNASLGALTSLAQNFVLLHGAKETMQPASGKNDFWCSWHCKLHGVWGGESKKKKKSLSYWNYKQFYSNVYSLRLSQILTYPLIFQEYK